MELERDAKTALSPYKPVLAHHSDHLYCWVTQATRDVATWSEVFTHYYFKVTIMIITKVTQSAPNYPYSMLGSLSSS